MLFKRRIILLYVLVAYVLITVGLHSGFELFNRYVSIIIGISMMLLAIPIHVLGKKQLLFYLISFLMNTFGLGLSFATYYEYRGMLPTIDDFIIVSMITFSVIAFFGAMTFPKRIKPYVKLFAVVVIMVLFIVSIVLWVRNEALIYSLFFYFLNTTYFFMVGMISASHQLKDLAKEMSLTSFGAFIILSIIVLLIVSEGEALEGIGEALLEGAGEVIGETLTEVTSRRQKIR